MALVDGQSLADRLAEAGRLAEAAAADIAWQIADALDYAHRRGVVHRDVKPSNILLSQDGRALLTDFGVALALDDPALTRTGVTVGTPAYMAPEQAASHQLVDGRADLYALGVTLYQMVTGRTPFQGSTPQVLHAHVYNPPPLPATIAPVSPALESIILRALAKEPTDRFQTGAAMAQALTALGDQTGLQPQPDRARPERWEKDGRSNRRWAWLGLALVIPLAAILWQLTNSTPATPTPPVRLAPTSTLIPTPLFTPTPVVTPAATTLLPIVIAPTNTSTPLPVTPTSTTTPSPTLSPTSTLAPPTPSPSPRPLADCTPPITTTLVAFLENTGAGSLGCPSGEAVAVAAAWQPFEHGLMLWREDLNLIYTLDAANRWASFGDTWRETDAVSDPVLSPPEGWYQPVRGFGKIWRERPGVGDGLGWATAEEAGFRAVIQEFNGSLVWYDPAGQRYFILLNNHTYRVEP
jgi:serine/threonine-protein kinase